MNWQSLMPPPTAQRVQRLVQHVLSHAMMDMLSVEVQLSHVVMTIPMELVTTLTNPLVEVSI